ncbi:thioredoxin family protein [Pinibacter soli]|uniref:Thioredoxin family protein n=1 Tax=Pinibacter soli TaxID=3044211 RepID=A0ABT6RB99_9BACT|nr:thioredoxin family protein [Pinibacter soli]MDI3319841.1 thioredoxin family protein [Pinibacter soli]
MSNRNKIIMLILMLGTIGTPRIMKAQGIEFMHDLDSALAKAKIENKPVFVDFYTSWCAPCKEMAKDVFPLENVARFYNKQFINCKVQCDDKGVGVEKGKQYQIYAYPTLMYLDKNGNMIHSAAGSTTPEGFIELGKIALDPDQNMFSLIREWNAHNREYAFVTKYFKALQDAYRGEKLNSDFNTYFNELTPADKLTKNSFEIVKLVKPSPFTPSFEYIEANAKKYDKTVGSAVVDKYISDSYLWYLKNMINPETRKQYEIAKAKFKAKNYPYFDEFAMFLYAFEVQDSTGDINVNEYMKRGDAFLQKYGKNNDSYTLALTSLLGNCTGKPDQTVIGIKWMEDLLRRNPDPKYLSTYFYILVRNYHCDKAQEVANEMRANAIKNNESTKSVDAQIASIDAYRARLAKLAEKNKSK